MKTLFTFISFSLAVGMTAQELPYTLITSNQPYTDLADTITVSNGDVWDDPQYPVPIGFDFEYMGETTDSLMTNGFGGQLISWIDNLENVATVNVLIPYGSDIVDAGVIDGVSISPISYKVEGMAPNRIFKMEWKNCGFYIEVDGNGTTNNRVSFQLWIEENTQSFEYRFGPNTIKGNEVHVPFNHPLVALVKNASLSENNVFETLWILGGDPDAPDAFSFPNLEMLPPDSALLATDPASGTVYRFDTGIVYIKEQTEQQYIHVFPSPANEVLFVRNVGKASAPFELLNSTGTLVQRGTLNYGLNRLAVENLAAGIYFLKADNEVKKWVKD